MADDYTFKSTVAEGIFSAMPAGLGADPWTLTELSAPPEDHGDFRYVQGTTAVDNLLLNENGVSPQQQQDYERTASQVVGAMANFLDRNASSGWPDPRRAQALADAVQRNVSVCEQIATTLDTAQPAEAGTVRQLETTLWKYCQAAAVHLEAAAVNMEAAADRSLTPEQVLSDVGRVLYPDWSDASPGSQRGGIVIGSQRTGAPPVIGGHRQGGVGDVTTIEDPLNKKDEKVPDTTGDGGVADGGVGGVVDLGEKGEKVPDTSSEGGLPDGGVGGTGEVGR